MRGKGVVTPDIIVTRYLRYFDNLKSTTFSCTVCPSFVNWTFKGVVTQSWAEFLCRVESLQDENLKGGTNNREMKWQHKVATRFDSEMDKPDKE